MYWVVLSIILLAESWTVFVIGWFPFYSWIRLFFFSYLVLPQTQGARLIYQDYVDPFLNDHEGEIEELIGRSHERAKALGLQYFYKLVDLFREKVLGLPPQPTAPPPTTGPAGYTQSFLSRFNLSTAGGSTASANDWYSFLSSALGSVMSTGDKSREVRAEELSASGHLLQRQMETMTRTEKTQYILKQREVLDSLRSALAREEQSLEDEPEADDLVYGEPLRKNRSDLSFDVVDDEDVGNRPASSRRVAPSRSWTSGWFGGNDHDSSGSSVTDTARTTGYERS